MGVDYSYGGVGDIGNNNSRGEDGGEGDSITTWLNSSMLSKDISKAQYNFTGQKFYVRHRHNMRHGRKCLLVQKAKRIDISFELTEYF